MKKLYIHNRGEVAVRIARTCRSLGIKTAVGYSAGDAEAMHVRVADESYSLGGTSVADSYLNIETVCQAIRTSGADAVHPGYGLLSENAAFARAVLGMGVKFVGPDPHALERFGDKLEARRLARDSGLPVCPGTDDAVDLASARVQAARIGFPLLVKAAAGGGGIGMLAVEHEQELEDALRTCSARGTSAFGDARVYLERRLNQPRHVEVQVVVLPNQQVHVLGERECSAQRRHQKVLEEGPSPFPALSGELRAQMYRYSESLMAAHPYRGLATVEFLLDAEAEQPTPYFLEVNARLQVEHPVTELLTGLDLVALQLEVTQGGSPPIAASPVGHAFEARLYAEDPSRGFIPQPGRLSRLHFALGASHLRVDSGYEEGDEITPLFDPLIAKICVVGDDRTTALGRLQRALSECEIIVQGKKRVQATNLPLLRRLTEAPELVSGQYDTSLVSKIVH